MTHIKTMLIALLAICSLTSCNTELSYDALRAIEPNDYSQTYEVEMTLFGDPYVATLITQNGERVVEYKIGESVVRKIDERVCIERGGESDCTLSDVHEMSYDTLFSLLTVLDRVQGEAVFISQEACREFHIFPEDITAALAGALPDTALALPGFIDVCLNEEGIIDWMIVQVNNLEIAQIRAI